MSEIRECRHKNEWYVVKRLRLLGFLCDEKGLYPHHQTPDPTNPRYSWYYYVNTPELEDYIDEWFSKYKKAN